jgi:hypothetical protein
LTIDNGYPPGRMLQEPGQFPDSLTRTFMRAASILGIILMALGVISLSYFASPTRLMFHSAMGLTAIDPFPSILGGVALVCALGLMLAVGSKNK